MGKRCTDCAAGHRRSHEVRKPGRSARASGYDARWDALSRRARRIQDWCTDCGRPDMLQADHLPSAWHRHERGLPLRLQDVDVVCAACNTDRGSSRPGSERYRVEFGDR
ncbi:hypothetical protein GCM10010977_02490 [Citricoccus zhacaiensis]|uniref:HNH endonuclease n=1 Tax=Citricoccus zhacaiensis TaxID=489142 RepID=A0ABQ2LML9_9MICC|nr:hypothetical protein GCM10010977_02490 [Citricoccus zhacaiensis]